MIGDSRQLSPLNATTKHNIEILSLVSSAVSGPIDLIPHLLEFSYFEDLYNNTISGNIVLSDSVGILNLYQLNGSEFIKIKMNKALNVQNYIEKVFRVYSVSDRTFDKSFNHESYTIHFCSEEYLISEQYRISKAYRQKQISDIVADIFSNILKVNDKSKKDVIIDDTQGVYDFVLPNKKIFETINWLSSYALPKSGAPGADFVFFENAQGYFFKSLQNLFTQDSVYTFTYNPKNISNPLNMENSLTSVLKMEVLEYFDMLNSISKGKFGNRLISFDPVLRTKTVTNFDYNEYVPKSISLNGKPVTNNYKDRFGLSVYDAPPNDMESGALRLAISNANHKIASFTKEKSQYFVNDYSVEKYMPYRAAQIQLSNHTRLKITLPGNTDVVAGMVVTFLVDGVGVMSGTSRNLNAPGTDRNIDQYLSGRYIISALRHVVTATTFVTILEICKESSISPYAPVNTSDSGWSNISKGNQ